MHKLNKWIAVFLLSFVVLGTFTFPSRASQNDVIRGVIVYIELDGDIYLLVGETNTRIQLTHDANLYHYQSPKFSPDGKYLAYLRSDPEEGENNFDLHVMNLETKEATRLAEYVDDMSGFSWSADGASIVFAYSLDVVCNSPDENTASGIWEINVDSTGLQEIVPANGGVEPSKQPVFSDDGNWIKYDSYPCFSSGSNVHTYNLTTGEEYNFNMGTMDWLPGSNMLAWTQLYSSGGNGAINLVAADKKQTEVLFQPENLIAYDPNWSPDGNWIVFSQETAIDTFFFTDEEAETIEKDLIVMSRDDSQIHTICHADGMNNCMFAKWSPYSDALIFAHEEGTQSEWQIYLLNTQTTNSLGDFGEGGVDWIARDQLSDTILSTETPEIQSTATNEPVNNSGGENIIENENNKYNQGKQSVLILSGCILFGFALIVAIFLIIFLVKNKTS